MMSDDELRSRMAGLADTTAIDTVTLEQVEARSRRRALQQRSATVLVAFGLVVGGAIGVVSLGDSGDDLDVAADDTGAAVSDDGDTGDGGTNGGEGADETAETAEARRESDDVASTTAVGRFFDGEFSSGPDRLLPWNGGFLAFGERFVPADPVELTFDGSHPISAYFPPEILDTLAEAGVTTIDEAMAVLEEAGLMQQATDIVTQNPEVLEWYNGVFSGGSYESYAEFSEDGENWSPVDGFSWPGGLEYAPQLGSNGSHLVAVINDVTWDEESGRSTDQSITVYVTDDLVTWQATPVPAAVPTVADYVHLDISPGQVAVTDDGWYLTVSTWQWIDLWSALPADLLDELAANDWDWRPTEAGIEILEWNWEQLEQPNVFLPPEAEAVRIAPDVLVDWEIPEPTVIRVVPWSELPFGYDEWTAAESGNSTVQSFTGDFNGSVATAGTPSESSDSRVISVEGGLFALVFTYPEFDPSIELGDDAYRVTVTAFRSADGRSWSPVALPDLGDDTWVDTAVAVEGGVLLIVSGEILSQQFYLGTIDGGFVPVDGPALGDDNSVWFNSAGASSDGVATVIDLGEYRSPEFVGYSVRFEYEGFEISTSHDGEGQATFSIVDLASGEILNDYVGDAYGDVPLIYAEQGVVVLDADGETIVEIPFEIAEQEIYRAESEAWEAAYAADPYVPDYRLVATRDGRTWTVQSLPTPDDGYGWYGETVVVDGRVLVSDGASGWATFDLP